MENPVFFNSTDSRKNYVKTTKRSLLLIESENLFSKVSEKL